MHAPRRDRKLGRPKHAGSGASVRGRISQRLRSSSVALAIMAMMLATFVVDTITPYQIAVATFYVVVVLLAARLWRRRQVVTVSLSCLALTIVSFLFTRHGDLEVGLANTCVSLLAIAATTYLALRMEAAHQQADRVRAHLERVARAVTMGELAASIAHEVNQPLAAISANAAACARWLAADPPNLARVDASITSIVQDAHRASEVLSRVRAHMRGGALRRVRIDPNALILETLALLQPTLRESRIEVATHLADDLGSLYADPVQVQQVLINLLVNAKEAVEENGGPRRVGVSSRREALEVCIVVEDSGAGLPAGRKDDLFEAFHSSKPDGMGIGLAICRSIVENHGGRLAANPAADGGGAAFSFTLPANAEASP